MKQAQALAITNAQLVTPSGLVAGALRCSDGVIVALGADVVAEAGDTVVDARGRLLAPGLVDLGVFAVDKPAFHFGGITRAALMPDQSPPLDLPSRVGFIAKSGKPDLWVHPLAAATRGLEGRELAELALMQDAGAKAVATGRRWIADSGVMLRLLQYAAMLGLVVVTHAEDGGLAGEASATAGEISTRMGLPAAPAEAEALAIARDIALAELAGARLHIQRAYHIAGAGFAHRRLAREQRLDRVERGLLLDHNAVQVDQQRPVAHLPGIGAGRQHAEQRDEEQQHEQQDEPVLDPHEDLPHLADETHCVSLCSAPLPM